MTLRPPLADAPPAPETPPAVGVHASHSTIRRVIGGTMVLLSTQPITWLATLLLTVYLPRYLDSRSMGELGLALAAAAIIGTVATFGLPTVLTRTVASSGTNVAGVVSASLVIVVGLSALGAALTILLGLTGRGLDIGMTLLILAMVWMVVAQVQALLMAVLAGQQRLGEFAWVNAAGLLVSSVGSVGVLMLGGTAADTMAVTLVVALAVTAFLWRRLRVPFDLSGITRAGLLDLGKGGLPFVAWNLLVRIRSDLDSIVLAGLLSVQAVGWWSAAQRIVSVPIFVPVMVTTPLLPALSSVLDDRDIFARTLRRMFELTVIVTVGISAAIAGGAPVVPATLGWDEGYAASVPVMQFMSPVLVLVSISMVLGTGVISLGRERRWLLLNTISAVLQYVVLFAAAPAAQEYLGNGSLAAVLGRMVSELVMVSGALILLPRGMIGWAEWFFAARASVAGAASVAAIVSVVGHSIVLAGVAGALTYGLGLLVLQVIGIKDLRAGLWMVQSVVSRRTRAGVVASATADTVAGQ